MKTLFFTLAAFIASAASAQAMEVDEIITKANGAAYYQGESGKAKVIMEIEDGKGNKRTRSFVILRQDVQNAAGTNGDQNFFIYFRRPADVNKTTFLVHKHVSAKQEDDRWLYLPALDLVKRIASSDKRTSFMGSNFFYEDVSGRAPSEDMHELLEETEKFYVLKSTPKNTEAVEFTSFKSWIHKKTFIPVKVEYTAENGDVYRSAKVLKVDIIDGFPTVTKARMEDKRTGGFTTMRYSDVKYNTNVPEDIFTERYLRNPPRKLLR